MGRKVNYFYRYHKKRPVTRVTPESMVEPSKSHAKEIHKPVYAAPTKLEKLARIIGSGSQIGMLIVICFGYFYTVRPVFQKEKID